MKYDLSKHLNQSLASLDQRLQVFKEHYSSLSDEQRKALGEWVRLISTPFPDDFEEFIAMQCGIGLDEDRSIGVEIEVLINGKTAKAYPQHLRQAITAWERGDDFTPPPTLNYT